MAYPFAPVSLEAVGGAEQILAMIDRGLTASGHESIVVGLKGSITSGPLVPVEIGDQIDGNARWRAYRDYSRAITQTLSGGRVDLVHLHGVDFAQYLPDEGVPTLVTLHLPFEYYEDAAFSYRRSTVLNAVSEWQWRQCRFPLPVQLVCNGIDTDSFSPAEKADFALTLGRICPEKGFHLALDAAASAGINCTLAGQVYGYPEHQRYFVRDILPRLDSQHRFIGPIAGDFKRRLLSTAKCVLIPSQVAETSSLVGMEALASGTPVVAFRNGALAEIVSDQKTGFLVDSVEEMARAIRHIGDIDPNECRRDACRRFSAKRMVARYLRLYQSMIEGAC